MDLGYHFSKIIGFISARPVTGGIEISDTNFRLVYFDGRRWQMLTLRLPPGVVVGGKVADYDRYVQFLKKLKLEVVKNPNRKSRIPLVVSLGSSGVYTQVFSLPVLRDADLDEAIKLNIKMASPMDESQVYSSYQIIGEDKDSAKIEVLSAFIAREVVDKIVQGLGEAGFLVMAVETKAVSIARLIRQQAIGVGLGESRIVLILDNESLDFLIIRRGQLYFEYINYWRDLKGEAKEMSLSEFRSVITRNLRQVLNYYSQHWNDKTSEVILVALGLGEEVKKIINEGFSIGARDLKLRFDETVGPEWFGALGGGLRSIMSRRNDFEMSLLGLSAKEEFLRERVVSFLDFWRVALPSILGVMVLIFLSGFVFLSRINSSLLDQSAGLGDQEEIAEIEDLKKKAQEFNKEVAFLASVRDPRLAKSLVVEKLVELAIKNRLNLIRFGFSAFGSPVSLSAEAKTDGDVLSFKTDLESEPRFEGVNFSLTDIRPTTQGFEFSISFSVIPLNTD